MFQGKWHHLALAVVWGLSLSSCGGSASTSPAVPSSPVRVISMVTVAGASNLQPGQSRQFTAQATYTAGSNVDCTYTGTWQSSNALAATVSDRGMVTGVAPGVADIRATCEGLSGAARVTVGN